MSDALISKPSIRFPQINVPGLTKYRLAIAIALSVYSVLSYFILKDAGQLPHFDIDFTPLFTAPVQIQIHAYGAIATFFIGLVLLFAPKGFRLHRTLGWSWVVTMAITAFSSFFIKSFSPVHFSPIHALSAWTLIGLPMGIAAVRRRNIKEHRKQMTGMFVGGMLIAGLFAFLPGRMMFDLFFSWT